MERGTFRENVSGFTLLELLLAMFIFGVVVSSVYGAYMSTFRTITSAEVETERNQKARIALERVIEDLEAVYIRNNGLLKGESQEIDTRRGDKLEFTSNSHVNFSRKKAELSMAVIRYSVERDEDTGNLLLYRADMSKLPGKELPDDDKGFLLCNDLWQFRLDYIDTSGNEIEEWDTDKLRKEKVEFEELLPALVEIQLQFANAAGDKGGSLYKTAISLGNIKQGT